MDFAKDIAGQRKRSREDYASHSISKESNEYNFSVSKTKLDLTLLKATYDLLSSKEKYDFEFELVLTIDEYHQFLRCSPTMDSHTFTPKQQHMQLTSVMVQEMLQRICGFSFDFTQPLLSTSWDTYGFNWDTAFTTMGKSLANMRSFERIRFVPLGLSSTSAFNTAPTVVAETLRSMQHIRAKSRRQFGEAQGVPYLNNGLPPPFDYASPMKIVDKISEARELWVKCRMLSIWKENGTIPEYEQWSHAQRAHLQEKYDGLALEHELLKRGKELSDQQVMKLKDKITLLEKDLAANRQVCVEKKRSSKFAKEQKRRLLQVKADLKAKEEENKELVEKMAKQQKLEEEVARWKNVYNNLLSDYSALQKELQVVKQSKQGGEETTS
ncbi:hypothetical protein SLEP1_g57979 [Rubroshorea leprosula]|uniref:Uncharacterized protein n=1 Tax=Rubroshorea leprosula TaxID=152421 RepID=A0AAV5MQN5_9ROSI|nr:hypothetical protein SLEP1_g57979 [Rubroshorea leprosula]